MFASVLLKGEGAQKHGDCNARWFFISTVWYSIYTVYSSYLHTWHHYIVYLMRLSFLPQLMYLRQRMHDGSKRFALARNESNDVRTTSMPPPLGPVHQVRDTPRLSDVRNPNIYVYMYSMINIVSYDIACGKYGLGNPFSFSPGVQGVCSSVQGILRWPSRCTRGKRAPRLLTTWKTCKINKYKRTYTLRCGANTVGWLLIVVRVVCGRCIPSA